MTKKKKRPKKVDIRKKRSKFLKEQKKTLSKEQLEQQEKKTQQKTESDKLLDLRLKRETKLYWMRALSGALSALVGRLFLNLIGWLFFLWMLCFWFFFPFLINKILKYEYKQDEWTWKNVIKPGLGIFFFMFMIVGTLIHTLLKF